jgi:GntR family transcriptional regulator
MQLHIHADGVPIYAQIVRQVKHQVAAGRLRPGDELPPIRVLAKRYAINPGTVARAYRELEESGVVVKRGTTGTFIAEEAARRPARERAAALAPYITRLLDEAHALGVPHEELITLIRRQAEGGAT